jgi:hypothetical protein
MAERESTTVRKALIERLIKPGNNINWPQEMKATKTLFSKKANLEFWKTFNLPYKLNSLMFLLSARGQQEIEKAYREFVFQIPDKKTVEEQDTKVGEDIPVTFAPKTFKDFLKNVKSVR